MVYCGKGSNDRQQIMLSFIGSERLFILGLELVLGRSGSGLFEAARIISGGKLASLELQLQNPKRKESAQQLRSPRIVPRYNPDFQDAPEH